MGFGYLLIGYLITFVLHITVSGLGFGGASLLAGCGLMLMGLCELNRYHKSFWYAKCLLFPLLAVSLFEIANALDELFLWNLPLFGAAADGAITWITFLLLILFNLSMLMGIRMLSQELGIMHMATAAIRNSIFVGLYAVLYLIANMPLDMIQSVSSYLVLPVVLTNIVWVFCNLVLLLSCNKNICRAGDEEQPAKPSRIGIVNRMNEAYERNRQKAIDNTTREAEEVLRRRKEKREQKKKKKKK